MPSIVAVETALPDTRSSLQDVAHAGAVWLQDDPEAAKLFERFLRSSDTGDRHFTQPLEAVLTLGGMGERAAVFEEIGPTLGEQALRGALQRAGRAAAEIDALLFTSCSCPSIPSIDALIAERTGLPPTVTRLPIFQHGCAAGVVGLARAGDLTATHHLVALTSVELCSLVFQPQNHRAAQLVGAAIFADGAACALVTPAERGLVYIDRCSYLLPDTRHLMGYDIGDDGMHLRLDRDLPRALAAAAPLRVGEFLARNGLSPNDVAHWLLHPGGVKILDFLEASFALRPTQARWSRDVLRSVGNLSSATILFVLKAFLDAHVASPGEYALMLGIGPGLTLETILFRWSGEA